MTENLYQEIDKIEKGFIDTRNREDLAKKLKEIWPRIREDIRDTKESERAKRTYNLLVGFAGMALSIGEKDNMFV